MHLKGRWEIQIALKSKLLFAEDSSSTPHYQIYQDE